MVNSSFLAGMAIGLVAGASMVWLSDGSSDASSGASCLQSYPNIPGKLLLDNDKVVIQRFTFPPGQWEGVHAHPANQIYIHLTEAHWKARFGDRVSTGRYPAGSIGWYGPVHLEDDHESVNIGPEPIDLIWVTLKDGCNG